MAPRQKVDSSQPSPPPAPGTSRGTKKKKADTPPANQTADPGSSQVDPTVADPPDIPRGQAATQQQSATWLPQQAADGSLQSGDVFSNFQLRKAAAIKEVGLAGHQFFALRKAVLTGLHAEHFAKGGAPVLPSLKGLEAEDVLEILRAAKEKCATRAASELVNPFRKRSWEFTWTKIMPAAGPNVRAVEMDRVTDAAFAAGKQHSEAYLLKKVGKAGAEKVFDEIFVGDSRIARHYLRAAAKDSEPVLQYMRSGSKGADTAGVAQLMGSATKATPWWKMVAHSLNGLMTLYDACREFQIETDPKASTQQRWGGRITLAADLLMFVPCPPIQILAAVGMMVSSQFRDSKHPWQDFKALMARVIPGFESNLQNAATALQ